MPKPHIYSILFIVSLFLIGLNITGLFIDLRNEEIYDENLSYHLSIKVTEKEFYKELNRIETTPMDDSLKTVEITNLVKHGMAHYWKDEGIHKYNLTIPAYENYILYLLSFFNFRFEKYEFLDWKKAVERGVGLCSEHSIVLSELLTKNGISSKIVMLDGHVVVTAHVNDKWITLDPDLGVIMPFSIREIEKMPDIIDVYYLREGYDHNFIERFKKIYGAEGNIIYEDSADYKGPLGFFERFAYWAVWGIPMLLAMPFLLYLFIPARVKIPGEKQIERFEIPKKRSVG